MKIKVNGTGIHIEQQGSGEIALVFLHYYGGSSRTWESVISQLPDHYRTVAIDHRGWGAQTHLNQDTELVTLLGMPKGLFQRLSLNATFLLAIRWGKSCPTDGVASACRS